LPGVDVNAAMASAPMVERRPVQLPPTRERMDTLPPARRRGRPIVIALVVLAAAGMLGGLFVVMRGRLANGTTRVGSPVTAEAPPAPPTTRERAASPEPSAWGAPSPQAASGEPAPTTGASA